MRTPLLRAVGPTALALTLFACSDAPTGPSAGAENPLFSTGTSVRINEFHYDNASTDFGEAIEIAGPAGTSLDGWSIVLYNGSNGAPYNTRALTGTLPTTCDDQGVVVVNYPANGIQNGSPDGIALVDAAGQVVEFLSYEGNMTAVGGPADGMESTDVGVSQAGNTSGDAIQRTAAGGWARLPSTFGACNDGPPPPPGNTTLVISEVMGNPLAASSASWGEWFEVHNTGTEPVDLQGWTLVSGGQAPHVVGASVVVPAGAYAVLGRGDDVTQNGAVLLDYNYYTGGSTLWLDDSDWLVLRAPGGSTVDSVAWTGTPRRVSRAVRDLAQGNADGNGANWGYSTAQFGSGDLGTPGAANGTLSDEPASVPAGIVSVRFVGRDLDDPGLPVGFQDQLFATARDASGTPVETPLAWSSDTPALASVDQDGVVTARSTGVAWIRATSPDGRYGVYPVPVRVAVASATAVYDGNTEFGEPADGDASDDFIIRRDQLTSSYNRSRGTPNWVSYSIDPSNFGPEDRCDCFTPDPALPAGFATISTADYTGAGSYHGYGIDRGHLARSFDRTAGSLDNAVTFYFSNIIPQAADNNQGPWSALEDSLGKLARFHGKEVYVVAGVSGSLGTLKGEGKVVIPARTWKVAVIMPAGRGLADVSAPGDVEIIAVDMPNVAGIRSNKWYEYKTTVNAIEAASGYDLLDKLPNGVEWIVESGVLGLQGMVDGLLQDGTLTADEGAALHATLRAAVQQIVRGNGATAANQVGAFINQVRALQNSGRLSAADAERLIAEAQRVAGNLG
jgi:DNA/RNA endonuclease G (NUC1)